MPGTYLVFRPNYYYYVIAVIVIMRFKRENDMQEYQS